MPLMLQNSVTITFSTANLAIAIDIVFDATFKTWQGMYGHPYGWIYKLFHNIFG